MMWWVFAAGLRTTPILKNDGKGVTDDIAVIAEKGAHHDILPRS